MSDIKHASDDYKSNRPSQILKSEYHVKNVLQVLSEDYIKPFDSKLSKDELYNLSSGVPIERDFAKQILKVKETGEMLYQSFVDQRIKSKNIKIHDPIKREKLYLFKNTGKKVIIKQKEKGQNIEINRQILGKLLAYSAKFHKTIDFEHALSFPLSPVPLSLAHPDGSRRKTNKSAVMNTIRTYQVSHPLVLPPKDGNTYMVDLMALLRTVSPIPETYADLARILFNKIPPGYSRVDIVADTYKSNSLKDPERNLRGISSKVMISSSSSKIPRNFNDFLKNGENKTRLIELIKNELVNNRMLILTSLDCECIFFSMHNICYKISKECITEIQELSSNQEEVDTKLLLHAKHALRDNNLVIIRSPSGDVDINILFLAMFQTNDNKIWLDYNTGDHRRVLPLNAIDMDSDKKSALIGFHALTGNDYVSSFFKRSKEICWKIVEKHRRFTDMFKQLGNSWNLEDDLTTSLEEFVCLLYGKNSSSIKVQLLSSIAEKS